MQNPPGAPGPPPAAASGIDKRTGALLSYLLGWVTGVIFLFVGKNDPDVKYHGAQSIVFFGALTVLSIICSALRGIGGIGVLFGLLYALVSIVGVVGWIFCLYKAWTGNGARFEIPVVGGVVTQYAQQLADAV